jgi:hypothetical protein
MEQRVFCGGKAAAERIEVNPERVFSLRGELAAFKLNLLHHVFPL